MQKTKEKKKEKNPISKLYANLTYYDQYGSSVWLIVLILLCLLLVMAYCYIVPNIESIKDDWVMQRCKPYILPFAGIINKPDDSTMMDFTSENFTYCTQNIIKSVTAEALIPLTFITNFLQETVDAVSEAINSIRAMFDKVRTFFKQITQELMGRLMNVMIALQQIIIGVRDFMAKMQGTLTATLFTSLGT